MRGRLSSRASAISPNIEYIDNGDFRSAWLSADGITLYSWGKVGLYTSTDDGDTWQGPWHEFPQLVHGVRETNDGELLVSVFYTSGFYAGLWRSTGWSANHSTAVWTEVLTPSGQAPISADPATFPPPAGTTGTRSNYFTSWFGFHVYTNGYVIVNEYGIQANGTSIPGARYVFLSTDNGKPGTWTLIRDLFNGIEFGLSGQHMHGAAYDPYWDRFWFTAGDHGCHTEYSDDHGATWITIPGSQPEFGGVGGQPGTVQSVQPFAFPDRIVFTTDGPIDGIMKIERSNGRLCPLLEEGHGIGLPHTSNLKYTGATIYQRSPKHPAIFAFYCGAGSSTSNPAYIVISDPFGERFYDSWVDTLILPSGYGVFTALGPTAKGKLIASIGNDGRSAGGNYTMLRADFPVIL